MSEIVWIRSHVERCLQDIWDRCDVKPDGDGDYGYRWGTAACYIRVEGGDPPLVRVWAHAVVGVKPTVRLLREVNDLNTHTRTAHVVLGGQAVVVEHVLHPAGLDRDTLRHACSAVGAVADEIGATISAVYGGSTPFPADEDEDATDREAS